MATAAEREALKRRLDLVSLDDLKAAGALRRGPRAGVIIVQGKLEAQVVQQCVVTLDPVTSHLLVPFERYFTTEPLPATGEIVVGVEDEEPDPLVDDVLDIGELVVEELSLSLDPYPRSPDADAVLAHFIPKDGEDDNARTPFGKLQSLKRRADRG